MNCLICGKEIPKGKPVDDAVLIRGILEDGTWYDGYGFICTLTPCFIEFKKRLYLDRRGSKLVFNQ